MSQFQTSDYHFCTLNELQTPKPLPSLNFVAKLLDICHVPNTLFESSQRNMYDRKNHILYINNYQSYSRALQEKYGRTVLSFEKQMKMMGYKKRKIKQHPISKPQQNQKQQSLEEHHDQNEEEKGQIRQQLKNQNVVPQEQNKNRNFTNQTLQQPNNKNSYDKYMLVWRTNKSQLIEKELNNFQQTLSLEVSKAVQLKQIIEKRKNQLDIKLETIIFQSLLNSQEGDFTDNQSDIIQQNLKRQRGKTYNQTILERHLKQALTQLKKLSNQSQLQSKQLVKNISKNLGNELELYRMLIYKESKVHNSIQEEE